MKNQQERLSELETKLQLLLSSQIALTGSLTRLQEEINQLKAALNTEDSLLPPPVDIGTCHAVIVPVINTTQPESYFEPPIQSTPGRTSPSKKPTQPTGNSQSAIEKFIGENLINKIGIAITVIGVAIGAKYSIEHELVSPATRIILGYLMAAALLAFGIKLKKSYENYSAVLVSGAIAIMYFITYAAFSYYAMMPRMIAFSLMLLFTGFGVSTAINYNKQVIAHTGLVGAYAVPFLLGEKSGKVGILFTYIAIINVGILIIALKKYWKSLYYSAFIITWLIFVSWYIMQYSSSLHFNLSLIFAVCFFAIFHLVFLAYKIHKKEVFNGSDIWLVLINAFIFYGLGYSILQSNANTLNLTGSFTLVNALLHAIISLVLSRQNKSDKNLVQLITGLAIVFLTITIPVQFEGNWVTLLWIGEAVILFWIGKSNQNFLYEKIARPLIALALCSLLMDWFSVFDTFYYDAPIAGFTPIANVNFISSLLFAMALGYINYLQIKHPTQSPAHRRSYPDLLIIGLPASLLLILYFMFRLELEFYFRQLYLNSFIPGGKIASGESVKGIYNENIVRMKTIWVINYSMMFFSLLSIVNIKRIQNHLLAVTNLFLTVVTIIVFLTQGLYVLQQLTDNYLQQPSTQNYQRGQSPILIRYVSYCFVATLLVLTNWIIKQKFISLNKHRLRVAFDLLLHSTIVWIASADIIYIMKMLQASQPGKLGISIFWGLYALFLIVLGISKNKVHIRIGAITLFAVTILKLFFYDLEDLDTIAKTIIFILLGILLLIVSFLYNKYKGLMNEDPID
ncbi:MAG: DUF2339 domain-containing protein [Bacteroidota bacterium]